MNELDDFLKQCVSEVSAVNMVQIGDPSISDGFTISSGANGNANMYTNGYVYYDPPAAPAPTIVGADPSSGITWITTTGTGTIAYPPTAPQDTRVIQATPPRLEDVFVEIVKAIQKKGGNISEVRDILNRHKLKVVDHDGEVIFDSEWDKKIKTQDL